MSPAGVSLTEPVTLNGPPNSFCSALKVRSHLSSVLEMSAPIDTIVSVGRTLKRSAWLLAQPWFCAPPLGRLRVIELGLLLRGIDAGLDRGLVPAQRGAEARSGDSRPRHAGRLVRDGAGGELLGLEVGRRNRGLMIVDSDFAVPGRRERTLAQRPDALELFRLGGGQIQWLVGRQLERRLGRRTTRMLLLRLGAGDARNQDQRDRHDADRQKSSRIHLHFHAFEFPVAVDTVSATRPLAPRPLGILLAKDPPGGRAGERSCGSG